MVPPSEPMGCPVLCLPHPSGTSSIHTSKPLRPPSSFTSQSVSHLGCRHFQVYYPLRFFFIPTLLSPLLLLRAYSNASSSHANTVSCALRLPCNLKPETVLCSAQLTRVRAPPPLTTPSYRTTTSSHDASHILYAPVSRSYSFSD